MSIKVDKINEIINATINDVQDYLISDTPMECHAVDVEAKLAKMKEQILDVMEHDE